MKLHISLAWLLSVLLAAGLASCDPDEESVDTSRTVIVYMMANNSLSYNSYADLREMKSGARAIGSGHLIVYHHPADDTPRLLEITPEGEEITVETYDTSESSASIARMKSVIERAKLHAPADSYGLVLWSHANGWQSDDGVIDEPLDTYSFGEDGLRNPKKMRLQSLVKALDGNRFDFIYFDCCHMATVEVAYELRHLTPWIIGCPTELEMDGMPYDDNLGALFAPRPQLELAVSNTFKALSAPGYNGCCISLIATDALDRLADVSRRVMASGRITADYEPVRYFRTRVMPTGIFDMYHYFSALSATDLPLLTEWRRAFAEVVTATHTSPTVYTLPSANFHGLGCNIITDSYPASYNEYDHTAWYRDVIAPSTDTNTTQP